MMYKRAAERLNAATKDVHQFSLKLINRMTLPTVSEGAIHVTYSKKHGWRGNNLVATKNLNYFPKMVDMDSAVLNNKFDDLTNLLYNCSPANDFKSVLIEIRFKTYWTTRPHDQSHVIVNMIFENDTRNGSVITTDFSYNNGQVSVEISNFFGHRDVGEYFQPYLYYKRVITSGVVTLRHFDHNKVYSRGENYSKQIEDFCNANGIDQYKLDQEDIFMVREFVQNILKK